MILLPDTLKAWQTPAFRQVFKREFESCDKAELPLQAALSQSSYVADEAFSVLLLAAEAGSTALSIRAGISYAGIIAGCSCADDPSADDTRAEYCEIELRIDFDTAKTQVSLVPDTSGEEA